MKLFKFLDDSFKWKKDRNILNVGACRTQKHKLEILWGIFETSLNNVALDLLHNTFKEQLSTSSGTYVHSIFHTFLHSLYLVQLLTAVFGVSCLNDCQKPGVILNPAFGSKWFIHGWFMGFMAEKMLFSLILLHWNILHSVFSSFFIGCNLGYCTFMTQKNRIFINE